MSRQNLFVVLALISFTTAGSAQTVLRFNWQKDQVLLYRVEQTMTASESLSDGKTESTTKASLVKRWNVQGVDAAGVATLQLSLDKLRLETTTGSGEVLLFDSADPVKSNPQMKEQLSKYVGQPIAVLRMDSQGRLIEVKKSDFGPASRFEADLPFQLVFPIAAVQPGQSWERAYKVTLEPPQGTGEKHDAVQRYTFKSMADGAATIELATTMKAMPESILDRVPLLQSQPKGEITFDIRSGLMRSARLVIDKELKNHQGEGTSYHFERTCVEEYIGNK
jgi:hypothetical protein